MSNTDVVEWIMLACAAGAIATAFLLALPIKTEGAAAARRFRAALAASLVLLLLAGIGLMLTQDSIRGLQAQVSALESAQARDAQALDKAWARHAGEAIGALEARLAAAQAQTGKGADDTARRLAELERTTVMELAAELAETQRVVSEQAPSAPSARFERQVLGTWIPHPELAAFYPRGQADKDPEGWSVELVAQARGVEMLKALGRGPQPVCLKGVRSVRGGFGHGRVLPYLFIVTEVVAVGPQAAFACGEGAHRAPRALPERPAGKREGR